MENERNFKYVGDGVYAEFNGYSIEIHVDDPRNPTAVEFEEEVLQNLINFARNKGMIIK